MESCFAYIANKPFKQPPKDTAVDTLSRKQTGHFWPRAVRYQPHDLAVMGWSLETWQIEDESIRGARLLREENVGVRLGPSQLVAVRPTNANAFLVGNGELGQSHPDRTTTQPACVTCPGCRRPSP